MANRGDYQHYSATSIASLTRHIVYTSQRKYLNLVFQKELPSERPIIDSTKAERLSFYRIYTTTSAKSSIIESQRNLNNFLWFYAFNVFFKTLPHCFVHFFLAVYAPEEHMFITKMVPISFGCKYLFVMVAVLELTVYTDLLIKLLHYNIFGIIDKNPWNRCPRQSYHDIHLNLTLTCFDVKEFSTAIANTSYTFLDLSRVSPENKYITLAQLDYYRLNADKTGFVLDIGFFIVIWSALILLHHEARRNYFWKILHYSNCGLIMIDVIMTFYIVLPFFEFDETHPITRIKNVEHTEEFTFGFGDIGMFADSITAPPVVHILTARSTQPIEPSQDSSAVAASNAFVYILRGLLRKLVRMFCESLLRAEIPVAQFNQQYWLYFWPIFFQSFYLGDIFSVVYMFISFVTEFTAAVVTLNCLMEMILYEWTKLKRWMVMIAIGAIGLILYPTSSVNTRMLLWIYGKGIATLADTLCLYVMYPIGRLVDDFTFHYGKPPTRLRIISLQVVPFYYMAKLYTTLDSLWAVMRKTILGKQNPHYVWCWTIMVVPILAGMLYIVYLYLVKFKMTWPHIFRPIPKWGPRDFSVRQLRKQFDSRFYIGSEAPKLLSRYLMSKRDSKVYKVDVRYDMHRKSTASKAVGFGKADEKKISSCK